MSEPIPQPAAQIKPLPTPPTLKDSANFDDRGDAFLEVLPGFQEDANALAANVAHNTEVAYTAAQAAVPAAAQATQARDQVLPARNEVLAARDQTLPAAASAKADADRAEAAVESVKDGPVTSVNNQTGVVDLTADLHSIALLF